MTLFSLALRHSRRLSTAATTVEAAKSPSISLIKAKFKNVRDPDEALKIYNSISTSDPSTSCAVRNAQNYLVRLLAESGRFPDIETFLESQKSTSHITEEYFLASLIRSYGTAGMFENALRTYEQIDELGTPRSVLSFNALLWACTQCKLFDRVITYFDELPAKFGFSPDKFSCGMLIKSYCEMGSPEIAIEKMNEMQGRGLEPDVVLFNTIFHSLYANGRIKEAESFWDEMVSEKGVKPDSVSYDVKLRHIQPGDTYGFNSLVEEMKNAGVLPNSLTYYTIIAFYCENEMMDEANKVYAKMMRHKRCNPRLETFTTMVFHKCKRGEFLSAYKVYKESVKHHKVPDFSTLKCLVEGLTEKGYKKEAKDLISESMKNVSAPDLLETWRHLADALGSALDETEEGCDLAPRGSEL